MKQFHFLLVRLYIYINIFEIYFIYFLFYLFIYFIIIIFRYAIAYLRTGSYAPVVGDCGQFDNRSGNHLQSLLQSVCQSGVIK